MLVSKKVTFSIFFFFSPAAHAIAARVTLNYGLKYKLSLTIASSARDDCLEIYSNYHIYYPQLKLSLPLTLRFMDEDHAQSYNYSHITLMSEAVRLTLTRGLGSG